MPECALCLHYESEHTPADIDPGRRCRAREYATKFGHVDCDCPGYEPGDDEEMEGVCG
ncbi:MULTISPECIES: hypothetical protein [Mycobacterium]|uniref:Uncharacterized protein n=1 Tax=Mycobacterium branderi TaxID=43348 RepID=A0ABM7KFU4_9MYCO|nr:MULTISPECIES: hypothetical protein [Mycobacterium]MCV7232785.1 hypothetical protein [Mycobacterium branderi]BBZ09886.1 hypothetical protein MBRA_00810 [Mycobacterium branderi]